jgi:tRNA dimethylallyltransferase
MTSPRCLLLAGPTAAGKSALGLVIAEEAGAILLSADAMQVYRGMDIGTAKPSAADRAACFTLSGSLSQAGSAASVSSRALNGPAFITPMLLAFSQATVSSANRVF